jgi:hypothetical protein
MKYIIITALILLTAGCSRNTLPKNEETLTVKVRKEFIEKHNGISLIPSYNGKTMFDNLPEGIDKPRKDMNEVEKVQDDIASIGFLILFTFAVGDTVIQWVDGPTIFLTVDNGSCQFTKIINPGFNRQIITKSELDVLKSDNVTINIHSTGRWNVSYSQQIPKPSWNTHCTIDLNQDGTIRIY